MKKMKIFIALFAAWIPLLLAQAGPFHFFDPDHLIDIQGKVERIDYRDVYGKKSPFLVLVIQSDDQLHYQVEVGPRWFLESDISIGMKIQIHGSLLETGAGEPYLIAQEISLLGERVTLRDRKGFPLWSQKGVQEGRGRRSGRGRRGKW